ncbi:NlpC/P60 family protein [Marivita sp. GX14005]|uniref:C40 family peptidase n=1 Tax=Marivita sp. GX14005 TaxID=2942276 RepID=UPI0020193CA2|nr:NlpC/P60 family protein [Marivita sp. GX14005]MCL3881801.1 NlpC/P60 family protein [Marivita sp. GX14005]
MTDKRDLWSNGAVAHSSLKGHVDAENYTEGEEFRVTEAPVAALRNAAGNRERELLWGQVFCVLDRADGKAFGFARRDGYAGYINADLLTPVRAAPSHRVRNRHTVALPRPDFKATEGQGLALSLGAELSVIELEGRWATIDGGGRDLYVPASHIAPLDPPERDPVAVAERLFGTPYLWGGNSAFGIDCSGLVQIACHACGIACPGDSDQQEKSLGETLPAGTPLERGDILFWEGHVGWIAGPDSLLHANAHHMAVAFEPLKPALARIEAQGDGKVTRHARLH